MSKLNIGVIGAGSISEWHLKAFKTNADVNMHAICDLNTQRAAEKSVKYGIQHVYGNYKEMLADPKLDAVSICTWNDTHAEIAIAALHAGKKVLVEKPLCRTVAEAYAIEKAVMKTGGYLQIGYVRRFAQNAMVLKKFIDGGQLGDIYYSKASCLRRHGNPGGWFADKEKSGGGPLIDLGVHVIDLCWYLMGRPKVKAILGNVYQTIGNRGNIQNYTHYQAADYSKDFNTVEDSANAIIQFENGASMMVDVSYSIHAKEDQLSINLFGSRGGAEVEPRLSISTDHHDTIMNMEPQMDHPTFNFEGSFQAEIDHFVQACLLNSESVAPVSDGVEMMKILCGIYESAQTGATIQF